MVACYSSTSNKLKFVFKFTVCAISMGQQPRPHLSVPLTIFILDSALSHAQRRPQVANSDIFFRGGASLLKPNHVTRYEYPCLLHFPLASLRLQLPSNASKRSRPQGQSRADFGVDGTTFLTVTRAYHDAASFSHTSARGQALDMQSSNPLGRAVARVTKYPGNTLLQSGKFATPQGLVYVVKRVTSVAAPRGECVREEQVYDIACTAWRGMQPPSEPGHDSWWMRLHDLYSGVSVRAFWSARDTMDKYNIPAPLVEW
jgi:hypothetical protein